MEKVQSADGTMIAVDRTGSGPALVLVVGAFCDRTSTRSLAGGLSDRFTVFEYDRRGRGDSSDTAPYSVDREVEDLAAVIAAAGGSAFVFGHSSGAALALEAASGGANLRALAVYEPPYTEAPSAELEQQLSSLIDSGQPSRAAQCFLSVTGMPAEAIAGMTKTPYWPRMCALAPTLVYDLRLCNGGFAPVDRLPMITVPTLALAGGASPSWARAAAQAVVSAVPGARQRVFDGQDHVVADEVLIPELITFFSDPRD